MRTLSLRAAVSLCALASSSALAQSTFSTSGLTLTLAPDGRVSSLIDTVTGQERILAVPAYHRHLCEVVISGVTLAPTAFSRSGARLTYVFGQLSPPVTVDLDVVAQPTYLVVTVAAVAGAGLIDEIRFINLDTDGSNLELIFRLLRFPDAVQARYLGIYGLDPFTRTQVGAAASGGYLWASAFRTLPTPAPIPLVGRRAALFTCPASEAGFFAVARQIETAYQIPLGVAARELPGVTRSAIFFRDVPVDMRDEAIQFAIDAGVGKVVLWAPIWADVNNAYAVSPRWGSFATLRGWLTQCRAAGLLVGAQLFPSIVPITSGPYVYGGCDSRLRRDRSLLLSRAIPAGGPLTRIETTAPPIGWPLPATIGDVRTVVIGSEIFAYTSLSLTSPYGFAGITRAAGQNAGVQAAHAAGAIVQELVTIDEGGFYEWSLPAGGIMQHNTDIAAALNQVGFDFVYADNLEDAEPPIWFVSSFVPYQLYSLMSPKPLWMEASGHDGTFSWPLLAVGGQIDYFAGNFRAEVDRNVAWMLNPIFTFDVRQLGWAQPSTSPSNHVSPDEFEYLLAKGLAHDAAVVIQIWPQWSQNWPNRDANLFLFNMYETLRLGNYFPAATKVAAQAPGVDFMLFTDPAGQSQLAQTQRLALAGGAYQLAGYLTTDLVAGARYATLWPTELNRPQTLFLPNLAPGDVQVRDFGGAAVAVVDAGMGYVSFRVDKRVYIRLVNVPDPIVTFGDARLTLQNPCPGDLNGDRRVDERELGILLSAWAVDGGGDYDGDGDTDVIDLGILLSAWGTICP